MLPVMHKIIDEMARNEMARNEMARKMLLIYEIYNAFFSLIYEVPQ